MATKIFVSLLKVLIGVLLYALITEIIMYIHYKHKLKNIHYVDISPPTENPLPETPRYYSRKSKYKR